AGVPDEHLLPSAEHERTALEQQRRRTFGSGHRDPLLADTDLAARPGTGKHSLRSTEVVLPYVQTRSGAARAVHRMRGQRHEDLRVLSARRSDHSQRRWWPNRSSANLTFPDEASCSSSGRSCVADNPVVWTSSRMVLPPSLIS